MRQRISYEDVAPTPTSLPYDDNGQSPEAVYVPIRKERERRKRPREEEEQDQDQDQKYDRYDRSRRGRRFDGEWKGDGPMEQRGGGEENLLPTGRKTGRGSMKTKTNGTTMTLSIWDDNVLQETWEEAKREYREWKEKGVEGKSGGTL